MFDDVPSCTGSWTWQDWTSFYTAWGTYKDLDTWSNNYGPEGYSLMFKGALSYLTGFADGSSRGWEAWDFFSNETNFPNGETWSMSGYSYDYEYKYALVPRVAPVRPTVEPGDDFAIFRYTAPASDSSCTVVGGADGLTGRTREYVKTGLSASTPYEHAVVCTDDPWGSTTLSYTTLGTLSGTGAYSVTVGSGSTTLYVDWDYDGAAPWGNTDSESCAAGCTVNLTSPNKGLVYYRLRRDAGGSIVGGVQAVVVQ